MPGLTIRIRFSEDPHFSRKERAGNGAPSWVTRRGAWSMLKSKADIVPNINL
jgi:hypothetical protein